MADVRGREEGEGDNQFGWGAESHEGETWGAPSGTGGGGEREHRGVRVYTERQPQQRTNPHGYREQADAPAVPMGQQGWADTPAGPEGEQGWGAQAQARVGIPHRPRAGSTVEEEGWGASSHAPTGGAWGSGSGGGGFQGMVGEWNPPTQRQRRVSRGAQSDVNAWEDAGLHFVYPEVPPHSAPPAEFGHGGDFRQYRSGMCGWGWVGLSWALSCSASFSCART